MGADETAVTDLSLAKSGPAEVQSGAQFTYTLTIRNNGPSQAAAPVATDTLPGGLTLVAVTPTLGSCTEAGGTIGCSFPDLAAGASVVVTITVTAGAPGTVTNTAVVSTSSFDADTTNNT